MTKIIQLEREAQQLSEEQLKEVLEFITHLKSRSMEGNSLSTDKGERQKTIQHCLEQLIENKAFKTFDDPVEWQKSQRQDRSLPGRKGD